MSADQQQPVEEPREAQQSRAARAGWDSLTEEQRQERIRRMQEGRKRKADQRAQDGNEAPQGPPQRARRDPTPRSRRGPKKEDEPTDGELVAMLDEMLAMPAIPAATILGCSYCAEHFVSQSTPTARSLVQMSQTSPGLRKALVRLFKAYTKLTYAGIIGAYLGKPMLHHLAPDDMYAAVRPVLKMPPRPGDNGRHASPQGAASPRPPATQPPPSAAGPHAPPGVSEP